MSVNQTAGTEPWPTGSKNIHRFTYQHRFSSPAPLVPEAFVHDSCSSLSTSVSFLSLCHLTAVLIFVQQPHLMPGPAPFDVACVSLLKSAQTTLTKNNSIPNLFTEFNTMKKNSAHYLVIDFNTQQSKILDAITEVYCQSNK